MIIFLSVVERQYGEPESLPKLAAVLCALAPLSQASHLAISAGEGRLDAAADLTEFERWMETGDGDGSRWLRGELTPASAEAVIRKYRGTPDPAREAFVSAKLLSIPIETQEVVQINSEGVCVLVFPTSTSTTTIARFLICVLQRMR